MSDSYLRGSYALWAGDYAGAIEAFSNPPPAPILEHQAEGLKASDFLIKAQLRRLTQLRHGAGRFREAALGLPKGAARVTAGGLRLQGTEHLRAVLFRTSARRFEMRGYLWDLMWGEELLRNASRLPSKRNEPSTDEKRTVQSGFSWEEPGDLFIEAHVGHLGLISAHGFWTVSEMPRGETLTKAFQHVLQELDP